MSSPNSNVPFKKGNQVVYIPNNNDYNNLTERKINNPYTLSTKQLVRRAQQSPEKEMQRIERMAKIKRAKMIAEDIESRKGPELPAKEKYMLISDLDKSILDIKNNINKPGGFEYVEKELRTMIEDINFKISEINIYYITLFIDNIKYSLVGRRSVDIELKTMLKLKLHSYHNY